MNFDNLETIPQLGYHNVKTSLQQLFSTNPEEAHTVIEYLTHNILFCGRYRNGCVCTKCMGMAALQVYVIKYDHLNQELNRECMENV